MSMNIKNERAHKMATQISHLTGDSLTQVVITALEMRLQTLQKTRFKPKAKRILEFAARFTPGVDPNLKSTDHGSILYGEDGLPQ